MPLGQQKLGWTGQGTELMTSRQGLVKSATDFIKDAQARIDKYTVKYAEVIQLIQNSSARKYAEADNDFAKLEQELKNIQEMRTAGTITDVMEDKEIKIMADLDKMLEKGVNLQKEQHKYEALQRDAEEIKNRIDMLNADITEIQQLEKERLEAMAAQAESYALKVKEAEAAQQAAQVAADEVAAAAAAQNLAAAQAAANAAAAAVTQQATALQNVSQGYQQSVSQYQQVTTSVAPAPSVEQVVEQKAIIAAADQAAEVIAAAPPEMQAQLVKQAAQEIGTQAAQATGQPVPSIPQEAAPTPAAIPSWMKYAGLVTGGLALRKLF